MLLTLTANTKFTFQVGGDKMSYVRQNLLLMFYFLYIDVVERPTRLRLLKSAKVF